ncbi:radical SAM protein [Lysinibacillus sp. JNUCC 51]|nr:radical SAM protein [Lysinibacillus sp. JNUCC-51]
MKKVIRNLNNLTPSRFNVIVKNVDSLKLYNSYTGKIAKFDNENQKKVLSILKSKNIEIEKEDLDGEVIEFLNENGYLVNKNTDEFRLSTALKHKSLSSNRTLRLIILINEDCNFRCTYCYEDFLKKEIKTEVQTGLINFLEENINNYNHLHISWFGGEPLKSYETLKKLSKSFLDICEKNNVFYSSDITTNGYLLTPEVFDTLIDLNVTSYQVTLDGTAETHNKYRVGRNGETTFDEIFSNLEKIRETEHEFHMILRSNINQEVSTVMMQYLDLVEKNFKEDSRFYLHFIAVLNLKGAQDSSIHLCDSKELFPIYEEAKERGFNFDFYKMNLQPNGSECYAANPNSYVIGSDGMIYKCTVAFNNPYNHVGWLKEDGEMEIFEERLSLWLSGGANEDSNCTSCYFRPSCHGNACPLERIESGTTPCPPVKKNIKKYINLVGEDLVYA